jgi:hypothetical protein
MRQVFGSPNMSGMSAAGLPYSNWSAQDIGVALMMVGYSDRVEIMCVRGMTNMGELFRGGQQ